MNSNNSLYQKIGNLQLFVEKFQLFAPLAF